MIKNLVLIFVLLTLTKCQSCKCDQLKSEYECNQLTYTQCQWDSIKSTCSNFTGQKPENLLSQLYCSSYKTQQECLQKYCQNCDIKFPCAWIMNSCTIFPGCTPFLGKSQAECEQKSKNCISDGIYCVDLTDCKNYLQQQSCQRNKQGNLCYWENSCDDVKQCSQLKYKTHEECNSTNLRCTVGSTGGCVELQQTCDNYINQISCQTTLTGLKCIWLNGICQEKTCETAAVGQDCNSYLNYTICVKTQSGGCETPKTCSDFTNNAGCIKDSFGIECIYVESKCVNKACSSAPQKYYQSCQSFLPNCISDNGQKCIENETCSAFDSLSTCTKSKQGDICYWNTSTNKCQTRTCLLANPNLTQHSECEGFLFSCTVNPGQGCRTKTCEYAPPEFKTNTSCENYLPGKNCVTRAGGGCMTNGECSKLSVEEACVTDINGNPCYWNPEENRCGTKLCSRASITFKTQEQCQNFIPSCQLAQKGEGCEEKSCENKRVQSDCTKNYQNVECLWQSVCQVKTCDQANDAYTTHDDCQSFINSCTVSNKGSGCMALPLQCDYIKTKDGCKIRRAISIDSNIKIKKCLWRTVVKKCVEYSCEGVIPDLPITNEGCKKFSEYEGGPKCYINNEENGCMKLPKQCSERRKPNCDVDLYDCIWNESKSLCVERTCINAKLAEYSITSCQSYQLLSKYCDKEYGIGCCTVNDTNNGCIQKKNSCLEYQSPNNCQMEALLDGKNCVWKDLYCVEYSCVGLTINDSKYSHANCQLLNKQCTVNINLDGCQNIANSCISYKIFEQCVVDDNGNECIWQQSTKSCDIKGCEILQTQFDAKYGQLKDYTSCQNYQQSCTVIQRAEAKGCVPRKKICSDYKVESQCHKTITNQTNIDDCVWDTKRCWNKNEVNCQEIVFDNFKPYTIENCESIALKCKANDDQTSCTSKFCQDFTTTTGLKGGPDITLYSQCKALSLDYEKCSIQFVNSKYKCLKSQDKCQDYKQLEHCIFAVIEGNCKWNANKCFSINADCGNFEGTNLAECQAYRSFCIYDDTKKQCTNGQCSFRTQQAGETLTHNLCQNYDPSCTFYTGDTTCSQIPSSCSTLDSKTCKYMRDMTQNGKLKNCLYYTDSSPQCVNVEDSKGVVDYCQKVTLDSYSFETCQNYSTACSVNREQTKCVQKKKCVEYTQLSFCYKDDTNYCIQTAIEDTENVTKCKNYSINDGCNLIFLGKTTIYTHQLCNRIDKNCTNKDNTGCQIKTCENYFGEYNHMNCYQWLSSCTVNLLKSGCIKMYENCADIQLQDECNSLYTEKQGYCIYKSELGACIQKTCLHSSNLLTNDTTCSNYMPTCTVALFGGCTQRKSCNLYESQLQCQYDQNSNLCFWNPTIEKCVDFSCDNIEQTIYFSTHKQCFELDNIQNQDFQQIQNRCTIKGFKPEEKKYGCTELKLCSEYQVKEQCVIDLNQRYCIWSEININCQEVQCATAGLEYRTHEDCQRYKFYQYNEQNEQCTVAVSVDENDNATFQGCIPVGLCENYLFSQQCRIGVTGIQCKWFEETKQCVTYNCEKAPILFTSHKQCEQYLYDCTVDTDSLGCMTKKATCSEYNEIQCHSLLKTGNDEKLCVWKDGKCMQRQCDNAPSETQDCKAFLAQCMPVKFSSISCRTQNCENYQYSTDSECKAIGLNSLCTTDGIRCVLRTTCEDAQIEEACKVNNRNQLCIWVRATATNDAYCKTSECEQAPVSVKKYSLCIGYSSYCTVKLLGGCKVKGDCSNFEESESCFNQIALDGKKCRWKDNKCGNYDCSDIKSTDHYDCSKYKSDCTTSSLGICVQQLDSCEQYTIKNQCVQTINQEPCVWMQSIQEGKKVEKCVKFTKCEDAIFTDHFSCSSISPYCTTNGTNCIPISKCETYQEPGCYKGIDQDGNGNCMYNYAQLTSTVKQCLKFTKCTDVYLKLTHQDCQQINAGCTSDGSQGCIDLQDQCSGYLLQVPCVITKSGKYCKWDQNVCKNETCEQIEGAIQVHQFCNLRQSTCTTNGLNCITMKICSSYTTEALCKVSWGTDGQCIWETNQCRRMLCSDIKNPLSYQASCAFLKDCIFDGTQCIDKANNCSDYKTGAACLFETINKDLCIWADQKCSKAESCNQLNSNQEACDKKTGCSYQQINGVYQCMTKTCPTLYELTKQCTFYKDSKENTKYCMFNGITKKCDEISPMNLPQANCFIQSNYTYYWNSATSQCETCNKIVVPGGGNTTDNTTVFSNLMSISFTMFLGMLW